jgi:tetratricopeptide (TPR) repeat protein
MESAAGSNALRVAQARYGQSEALLNLGRTAEAERLLSEAITAAPDAPETAPAQLGLARLYEQSGRQDEALGLYRQIVSRSRDEAGAEALVRLGDLLLRRGNATATIEELGRLDVLYAGYPEWQAQGYLVQARAFTNLGRIGDATQVYDRVIENFYDTPYAEVARKEKEAL